MAATRASGAHGFTSTVVHPAAVAWARWAWSAHPVRAMTGRPRSARLWLPAPDETIKTVETRRAGPAETEVSPLRAATG